MYLLDAPADAIPALRAALGAARRLAGRGRRRADLERPRARRRRRRRARGRRRGGPPAPDPGHPLPRRRPRAGRRSCPPTAAASCRWWPATGWPRCSRPPAPRSSAAARAAARPPPSCSTGLRAARARDLVVLPNDADSLAVAEAAAAKARDEGLRVAVIPTRASVQALAALAVHDPDRRFEDDVVAMTAAAGHCRHGGVTVAAREAVTMAGVCQPGDVLGIVDGDFAVIGDDLVDGRAARCSTGCSARAASWSRSSPAPTPTRARRGGRRARRGSARPEVDTVRLRRGPAALPAAHRGGVSRGRRCTRPGPQTCVGGPTAKELTDRLGIATVEDLLRHYPRRYYERGELTDLARLRAGRAGHRAGDDRLGRRPPDHGAKLHKLDVVDHRRPDPDDASRSSTSAGRERLLRGRPGGLLRRQGRGVQRNRSSP